MYKVLLCLRYLRTRYIALASIISVMLGVATMIVVNSVMAGFTTEMRDRIHGILADVIVETNSLDGQPNAEEQIAIVRKAAGEYIAGITATVEIPAMLTFEWAGQTITKPCILIGIDPQGKAQVGPLIDYLDSYHDHWENGKLVRQATRRLSDPPNWNLTSEDLAYRRQTMERDVWINRQLQEDGPNGNEGFNPLKGDSGSNRSTPPGVEGKPQTHAQSVPLKASDVTLGAASSAHAASNAASAPSGPQSAPGSQQRANVESGVESGVEQALFSADETLGPSSASNAVAPASAAPASAVPAAGPVEETGALSDDASPAADPGTPAVPAGEPAAPGTAPSLFPDSDPLTAPTPLVQPSDPTAPQEGRVYIGLGLIGFPYEDMETGKKTTVMMIRPGDDVKLSTVTRGRPPKDAHFTATVVDVFKSGMSEYDSNIVFCNLEMLQKVRGMIAPNGEKSITSLQIKLNNFKDADEVVKRLRAAFPAGTYSVRTWEQKQGPLLAAVEIEAAILNVLLFLIIAVAGFGILAIFYMIVVEKTRDIGVMKALGAGSSGVMSIFLSYGLALGVVGSGIGVVLGLLFVRYINEIEAVIAAVTGRKVFDEKIYYFPKIPTMVHTSMVVWVALGAMLIAILASILPARRASRLHPVEALRYE